MLAGEGGRAAQEEPRAASARKREEAGTAEVVFDATKKSAGQENAWGWEGLREEETGADIRQAGRTRIVSARAQRGTTSISPPPPPTTPRPIIRSLLSEQRFPRLFWFFSSCVCVRLFSVSCVVVQSVVFPSYCSRHHNNCRHQNNHQHQHLNKKRVWLSHPLAASPCSFLACSCGLTHFCVRETTQSRTWLQNLQHPGTKRRKDDGFNTCVNTIRSTLAHNTRTRVRAPHPPP